MRGRAHLRNSSAPVAGRLELLGTLRICPQAALEFGADVVIDIEEVRSELDEQSPRVKAIKKRRLRILEQRLDRFKKSKENLEIIEEQLATIEDVIKYIHEQSLTLRDPEAITFQLDTLLNEVEETEASVEEIEEVFRSPADILSDIDTFDLEDAAEEPLSSRSRQRDE